MKGIIFTVNGETNPDATLLAKGDGVEEVESLFKSFVKSIPEEHLPCLEYIKSPSHIAGECVPFGITDFQIRAMPDAPEAVLE